MEAGTKAGEGGQRGRGEKGGRRRGQGKPVGAVRENRPAEEVVCVWWGGVLSGSEGFTSPSSPCMAPQYYRRWLPSWRSASRMIGRKTHVTPQVDGHM